VLRGRRRPPVTAPVRIPALLAAAAWVATCIAGAALAQPADPGWPRELARQGEKLVLYAPQVDEWKEFRELQWRMAIQYTEKAGAKPVVGALGLHAETLVDDESHRVVMGNIRITRASFPGLDATAAAAVEQRLQSFVPKTTSAALHLIAAATPKPEKAPAVPVRNEPPRIFVASSQALLLFVDGKPVLAKIPGTSLEFVVNATLAVFRHPGGGKHYLLAGERWLESATLAGPWSATRRLPADFDKLAKDPEWAAIAKFIPAKRGGAVLAVFYSETPAEVILFAGKPAFKRVPGTGLLAASNTDSAVFLHEGTKQYYYLTSGRWFRASGLEGPWSFASSDLPPDFARIPPTSPEGRVLASVPGTEEAKDAVLLAQVPTVLEVSPQAAAKVKVSYDGPPKFEPIPQTSLQYAVNTQDKVIRVGDVYYLCLQGVWFRSTKPDGPWEVAPSVPKEIYTIPSSSPVYNVTYVTQVTTTTGTVQSSYTAGYMGAFVIGTAVGYAVAYGSGYYHPPYWYYPPVGYPVYRPYPTPYGAPVYNTATGAYGWGQAAYGPYGGAARAATYNPYTGTYARGATAYGPYGSRSAAQAYNPYTGTYAATAQGSSPTAQWGQSVVSRGNQAAYGQHYTTSAGTVGSVQTTQGGKAVGVSGAGGTDAMVGKTAGGDYYAAKDGNVYRNTGSGWQSYDSGNWNSVQKPATTQAQGQQGAQRQQAAQQQQAAQRQASGGSHGQFENMQHEAQSRQRGSYQAQQHQSGRGGGGRGGGGRRR